MSEINEEKSDKGIIVEIPISETTPQPEPTGEPEQDKVKLEGGSYEIPEKFKGKSVEDVSKSYSELEKEHGRISNEVGSLRKELETIKKTIVKGSDENLMKKINPEVIENEISSIEKKLNEEYLDDDEVNNLLKQKASFQDKLVDIKVQSQLNKHLADVRNPEALNSFKKEFASDDFTDDQVEGIYSFAIDHLSDDKGIITNSDLHAASLKLYGDLYKVALNAKAEQKVRKDISHIEDIKTPTVTSEPTKRTQQIDLTKLDQQELMKILKVLTPDQLATAKKLLTDKIRRG